MTTAIDQPEQRLYDRNFVFALASQISFVIANTLMAHYARWIDFLGGNIQQVGWITGIGSTLGILFRPWIAQWINRFGARRMWLSGYILFAAASMSNLLLSDLHVAIYIIRSCLILGAAIVFASGLTYITQTAPEHRRTEAIGLLGAGGFVGMLIGPFLGDLILAIESVSGEAVRDRGGFVTLFVVAALANVFPAVLLLFMRTPASQGSRRTISLGDFVTTVRQHWPGSILLVDFVFGICMAAPFIFVASFIDDAALEMGSYSVIGIFFGVYAGSGLTVRVTTRKLPDQIGPHKVLLVGLALMAIGMFSYALVISERSWLIIVPALLTGLGHGLMFHTMTSLTIAPFPNAVRGTGSALALMMLDLGTLIGAPVLGYIGDQAGYAALFATIGAACAICSIAYASFGGLAPKPHAAPTVEVARPLETPATGVLASEEAVASPGRA